jgi:hypothetical protein
MTADSADIEAFKAWYVDFFNEPMPPWFTVVHMYECWKASAARQQASTEAAHGWSAKQVREQVEADRDRLSAEVERVKGRANADRIALSELRRVMRPWHEKAIELGFDSVEDALAALGGSDVEGGA